MNDKMRMILTSVIFNVAEVTLIILIGQNIDVEYNELALILLLYFITRSTLGSALHYKKWYQCLVWSTLMFVSLFYSLHADIFVSILATVFTGYITSGRGNLDDMFMYKQTSKYKLLDDFIRFNYDDPRLIRYEAYLKSYDTLAYNLYILRFRKNMSWEDIKNSTGIYDTKKLNSILDNIYETLKYNLLLE